MDHDMIEGLYIISILNQMLFLTFLSVNYKSEKKRKKKRSEYSSVVEIASDWQINHELLYQCYC